MPDQTWIWAVRIAGGFHFLTLVLACRTPIPPRWEENLAQLPEIHRRFAVAQNFFIGAGIALWWGGRLIVLPWLRVWPALPSGRWRFGFVLLLMECAVYALAYGWLASRAR